MLYSEVLQSNKVVKQSVAKEVVETTNQLCNQFVERYGQSAGLKLTNDNSGYRYTLGTNRMNTDPFVRKALKIHDKTMYDSIRGYSKQPNLQYTLDTLAKYSTYQARKVVNKDSKSQECWYWALRDAEKKFSFHGTLYTYSTKRVLMKMEKSTAAGFSFPGKKKSDVVNEIGSIAKKMFHDIADHRIVPSPPCKLAQRGHLHDPENPKSRPVWVMPGETIVVEGRFAIPYIEKLKETKTVLIGENSLRHLINLLNPVSQRNRGYSAALDWSAFDTSIPTWLIDEAFKILFSSFDMLHYIHADGSVELSKRKGKNNQIRARRSYDEHVCIARWIQTNFKKTRIMLPNSRIMKKMHGIPSGSYFTQAIGSICNYIVVSFLMHMQGIHDFDLSVLGDDAFVRYGIDRFDLDKAAVHAWKHFHMKLNTKKSSIKTYNQPQKFLGYEVEGPCLKRSDDEFAKMVLYPERDVNYLEQSVSRVFAYYILGGVNNAWYCAFYHAYLGMYERFNANTFTLHTGMYRTLRYVAGLDVHPGETFSFDPSTVCALLVQYHFYFGYGLYWSDLDPRRQ